MYDVNSFGNPLSLPLVTNTIPAMSAVRTLYVMCFLPNPREVADASGGWVDQKERDGRQDQHFNAKLQEASGHFSQVEILR